MFEIVVHTMLGDVSIPVEKKLGLRAFASLDTYI